MPHEPRPPVKPVLPILLLAACTGRDPGDTPRPGSDFGREPLHVNSGTGTPAWGTADGMPLVLRTKFRAVDLPVHVEPVVAGVPPDSLGAELGAEDAIHLGDELAAMAATDGLLAAAETEAGLFVLHRTTPGATETLLAAWSPSARRLVWIADLAWAEETDEGPARHEAWIADLDSDGRPELVQRSVRGNPDAGGSGTEWSAWSMGPALDWIARPLSIPERTRLAPDDARREAERGSEVARS